MKKEIYLLLFFALLFAESFGQDRNKKIADFFLKEFFARDVLPNNDSIFKGLAYDKIYKIKVVPTSILFKLLPDCCFFYTELRGHSCYRDVETILALNKKNPAQSQFVPPGFLFPIE
jgi:hypothetical protein